MASVSSRPFDFDTFDADWSTAHDVFDPTDPYLALVAPPAVDTREAFERMMEQSRESEDPFATAVTIENEVE